MEAEIGQLEGRFRCLDRGRGTLRHLGKIDVGQVEQKVSAVQGRFGGRLQRRRRLGIRQIEGKFRALYDLGLRQRFADFKGL